MFIMESMKWMVVHLCLSVTSLTEGHYNGTSSSFIAGGQLTHISQHPHQVQITLLSILTLCGGSIISKNWILTAAHCVESCQPFLTVLSGSSYATKGREHAFVNIIIHEAYSGQKTLINDIAVARVSPKFIYNLNVQRIPLIHSGYKMVTGTPLIVTGWGVTKENGRKSQQLREVIVFSISNKYCQKLSKPRFDIKPCMLCAMVKDGTKDACKGDSGGPAISEDGVLVGVVSGGIGCARPRHAGYYTRVSCYRKWIRWHTGV